MDVKTLFVGAVIGAGALGIFWWVSINNDGKNEELFSKKQECSEYTEKRTSYEKVVEVGGLLSRPTVTVEGFYSPVANTCMTTTLIYSSGYNSYRLIDELTGRTEASAYEVKNREILRVEPDLVVEQVMNVQFYLDKVKYFKGQGPNPDPSKY